jgi:hypothetical protein
MAVFSQDEVQQIASMVASQVVEQLKTTGIQIRDPQVPSPQAQQASYDAKARELAPKQAQQGSTSKSAQHR